MKDAELLPLLSVFGVPGVEGRDYKWIGAPLVSNTQPGDLIPNRVLRDTEIPRDVVAPPHTAEVFDPATFPTIVAWIISVVRAEGYDALAGSGHSGLLPMAAACYVLGIPMLAVRKYDEHPKGSPQMINGVLPHRPIRYAIIDDFVASGETVERIDTLVSRDFSQATLGGLILFRLRADPPDLPPGEWSWIETTRSDVARLLGQGRAASLKIHGRHDLR